MDSNICRVCEEIAAREERKREAEDEQIPESG